MAKFFLQIILILLVSAAECNPSASAGWVARCSTHNGGFCRMTVTSGVSIGYSEEGEKVVGVTKTSETQKGTTDTKASAFSKEATDSIKVTVKGGVKMGPVTAEAEVSAKVSEQTTSTDSTTSTTTSTAALAKSDSLENTVSKMLSNGKTYTESCLICSQTSCFPEGEAQVVDDGCSNPTTWQWEMKVGQVKFTTCNFFKTCSASFPPMCIPGCCADKNCQYCRATGGCPSGFPEVKLVSGWAFKSDCTDRTCGSTKLQNGITRPSNVWKLTESKLIIRQMNSAIEMEGDLATYVLHKDHRLAIEVDGMLNWEKTYEKDCPAIDIGNLAGCSNIKLYQFYINVMDFKIKTCDYIVTCNVPKKPKCIPGCCLFQDCQYCSAEGGCPKGFPLAIKDIATSISSVFKIVTEKVKPFTLPVKHSMIKTIDDLIKNSELKTETLCPHDIKYDSKTCLNPVLHQWLMKVADISMKTCYHFVTCTGAVKPKCVPECCNKEVDDCKTCRTGEECPLGFGEPVAKDTTQQQLPDGFNVVKGQWVQKCSISRSGLCSVSTAEGVSISTKDTKGQLVKGVTETTTTKEGSTSKKYEWTKSKTTELKAALTVGFEAGPVSGSASLEAGQKTTNSYSGSSENTVTESSSLVRSQSMSTTLNRMMDEQKSWSKELAAGIGVKRSNSCSNIVVWQWEVTWTQFNFRTSHFFATCGAEKKPKCLPGCCKEETCQYCFIGAHCPIGFPSEKVEGAWKRDECKLADKDKCVAQLRQSIHEENNKHWNFKRSVGILSAMSSYFEMDDGTTVSALDINNQMLVDTDVLLSHEKSVELQCPKDTRSIIGTPKCDPFELYQFKIKASNMAIKTCNFYTACNSRKKHACLSGCCSFGDCQFCYTGGTACPAGFPTCLC